MPDPLLYGTSAGIAALVGAAIICLLCGVKQTAGATRWNAAAVLAMGLGIAAGSGVLSLWPTWPPVNSLDRFVALVVPTVCAVELLAAVAILPRWTIRALRLSLAVATPRILLHGSVYLRDVPCRVIAMLAILAMLLAAAWELLLWLSRRTPGLSIPISISLATFCAGMTVMMAGYLKGGSAALPLAACLAAIAAVSPWIEKRADCSGLISIGTVGLFSLLLIGCCFGRISSGRAMAMFTAPLLCWVSELPVLRRQPRWLIESLRYILVVLLLGIVLTIAKREFDGSLAPLLGFDGESIPL